MNFEGSCARNSNGHAGQAAVNGADFHALHGVLAESPATGLHFRAPQPGPDRDERELQAPPGLKDYFADDATKKIIQNNLLWAAGRAATPIFQFAYFMLPTPCNQRCPGCFIGKDKRKLPPQLDGDCFTDDQLDETLQFLIDHGAKAAVYGGGGELFARYDVSEDEKLALFSRIYSWNLAQAVQTLDDVLRDRISCLPGIHPCNQIAAGLYVMANGSVVRCPGDGATPIGTVAADKLSDLWARGLEAWPYAGCFNCGCPFKEGKTVPTHIHADTVECLRLLPAGRGA